MENSESSDVMDVANDPELIKNAQDTVSTLDILVCGSCNEVFHFIEEFQNHKTSKKCRGVPAFKSENSEKPQVWGFSLWKAKQLKTLMEKQEENPTSWEIYQRWCKLPEKETWIAAGQRLQYVKKMANAKLESDIKGKSNDDSNINDSADKENKQQGRGRRGGTKDDSSAGSGDDNNMAIMSEKLSKTSDSHKEEYIVKKIISKRYNTLGRRWEYEVNWKNYEKTTFEPLEHLENCKELVNKFEENLKNEKEKEKATPKPRGRPKLATTSSGTPQVAKKAQTPATNSIEAPSTGRRPTRLCKQRALNQVKQWCGNISDDEQAGKRNLTDDDSADSGGKKMRFGAETDEDNSDEEDEDTITMKKLSKVVSQYQNNSSSTTATPNNNNNNTSSNNSSSNLNNSATSTNGGGGALQKLPDNVLIPDAKGVVRISQKQLPSLSSGVYIMSKTSGIIKLDAAASKIATSGGQAIVKVNPRGGSGGQTQVRIIKKDQTPNSTTTSTNKATPNVTPSSAKKSTPNNNKQKTNGFGGVYGSNNDVGGDNDDDEDEDGDGLEEMEFPTDLPLPEPDSPPGEFTLDPITGKIAGKDYTAEEEAAAVAAAAAKASADNIDNIVKLAAADITEDDLKTDTAGAAAVVVATAAASPPAKILNNSIQTKMNANSPVFRVVSSAANRPSPSGGGGATTRSNILQKTLVQSAVAKTPRPKVLNQSIGGAKGPQQQQTQRSPVVRQVVGVRPSPGGATVVRQRIGTGIQQQTTATTHNSHQQIYQKQQQIVTAGGNVKKIGNTTIYKTQMRTTPPQRVPPPPPPQQTRIYQRGTPPGRGVQQRRPPAQQVVTRRIVQHAPIQKTVISMPSLVGDDDTTTTENTSGIITTTELEAILQEPVVSEAAPSTSGATETADLSTFTLADSDRPVFITGDDGTLYQVAGQNDEGQTILLTHDSDGQQQCLLVTNEISPEDLITGEEAVAIAASNAAAVAAATNSHNVTVVEANGTTASTTTDGVTVTTAAASPSIGELSATTITTADGTTAQVLNCQEPLEVVTDEQPVVAQFVRTEPPSPGGTHKVVVMLPDGDCVITQVSPEEYATLELGK